MYILVTMCILRYMCISTTPHVWSWYPSHKLLHFPNHGIQFQTIYKRTLYCTSALHCALPRGGHHYFHTVWCTVQTRERVSRKRRKDFVGSGFQPETLHGSCQNNPDTSRGKKWRRSENQNETQTKEESLKSDVVEWDAVKVLLWLVWRHFA